MRAAPVAAAGALLLAACSSAAPAPPPTSAAPAPSPTCTAESAVAQWPLQDRLRQLLFAGVFTGEADPIGSAVQAATGGIGGINFLGNDPQVYADGQLAQVTAAAGTIPPFLAVDQEGGRVQRLADLIGSQPSARTMGQTLTPPEVQQLAAETGEAMAGLGLTMNLAPVADVSSAPANTVIGDRSFSSDPAVVAQYAGAYADGLRAAGIVPVLKHFPGMGSATGNTDTEPATTPPLAQLRTSDLVPYETLLATQPVAVMMATADVPGLTDGEQAGLSPAALALLREEFGFDGVVMTDSLSGAAVASQYTVPEAAERAIAAGNDMALWDSPAEVPAVLARLTEAVAAGRITPARVDESVVRVLALKGVDACAVDLTDPPG
jgi:beta-N-acetylhexosaminidase